MIPRRGPGTVGDGSTQDSTGIEKYRNLWERQTREKAYDEVIRSARFAFEKGESDGNRSLSVYATAYLAQSYMLKDDDDSTCYWLAESFERIGKLPREDLFIVGTVNNIAGIRAMKSESDYSSALRYFKAALSAVEKAGDTLNQGAILQNIAHIYQVREDVSGSITLCVPTNWLPPGEESMRGARPQWCFRRCMC